MALGIWAYLAVYFIGILLGVWASMVLNVQLRRPGLTKSLALAVLGILLTVFLATHNTTMPEWLLITLWASIGGLAGLGSREARGML